MKSSSLSVAHLCGPRSLGDLPFQVAARTLVGYMDTRSEVQNRWAPRIVCGMGNTSLPAGHRCVNR